MMKKINNDSFILLRGWMIEELDLIRNTVLQVQILILLLSAKIQLLLLMNLRLLCRTEKFILQRLRRDRTSMLQVSLLLQPLRQPAYPAYKQDY